MRENSELMWGKAKKGEVRKLGGEIGWEKENIVIWYVCFAIKSAIL